MVPNIILISLFYILVIFPMLFFHLV